MQDGWHQRDLPIEDLIEGISKCLVAREVVDEALVVELGVTPVDNPPVLEVHEVIPWVRCRAGRAFVRYQNDCRRDLLPQLDELQRANSTHVSHATAWEVDPAQELIVVTAKGTRVAVLVSEAVASQLGRHLWIVRCGSTDMNPMESKAGSRTTRPIPAPGTAQPAPRA